MDHIGVVSPDRTPFASLNDVLNRLLPYHVFHEEPPCEDDFAKGIIFYTFIHTQIVSMEVFMQVFFVVAVFLYSG